MSEKDFLIAKLRAAAEDGDAKAALTLGEVYMKGEEASRDEQEACSGGRERGDGTSARQESFFYADDFCCVAGSCRRCLVFLCSGVVL